MTLAVTACGAQQLAGQTALGGSGGGEPSGGSGKAKAAGQLAEAAARAAVRGGLDEVNHPVQAKQLRSILRNYSKDSARAMTDNAVKSAEVVGENATRGALEALDAQLGRDGEGALTGRLAAASEAVSAAAVRGARDEIERGFISCDGPDRDRCVDRRLTEMSRALSAGVTTSVREALALPVMVAVFLFGAITALLLSWAWTRRGGTHVAR